MVSLTRDEQRLVERAQRAVEQFAAELAKMAPDWIDQLEADLRAERRDEARRKAVDLRNMAGTTGWQPLKSAAESFMTVLSTAPGPRLMELSDPILQSMRKVAQASDRGFNAYTRELIAEIEALSAYSQRLGADRG